VATLKDVAERAGVTVTTVSRMLNGRVNVSDATRARITAAMEEINYYPNEMARSLTRKKSNFIGLIVPSVQNYFFAEFIHHAEAEAEKQGCRLLLCVSNEDRKKEQEYYQMLLSNKVMGVIMAAYGGEMPFSGDAPVVVFGRPAAEDIPCALTDDWMGGHLAGNHLIERGCRHLLYLGGNAEKNSISGRRFEGLSAACAEHALPPPAQIDATWEEFIGMRYDGTIARAFREHPQADGIFASNDIMAAGVVQYCRKNRIRIPGQLKVVGYDDTSFASRCAMPLTTVHQPIDTLAQFSVDCVVRRSKGETAPTMTMFPVKLIERETT